MLGIAFGVKNESINSFLNIIAVFMFASLVLIIIGGFAGEVATGD